MRPLLLSLFVILGVGSVPATAGDRYGRSYYPSYSYSSCYTPTYYYPQTYYQPSYTQAYTPPATPAYTPPVIETAPDWKAQTVKYLQYKEDLDAFNKVISLIAPQASLQSAYGTASYAPHAGTVYGYTYQNVKEAYSPVDLNVMDQTTARLINGIQSSLSQANTERTGIVSQLTDAQARVAEIRAQAEGAALVQQQAALLLQSAKAAPSTKNTTTVTSNGSSSQQYAQQQSDPVPVNPDMQNFMKNVLTPVCGGCHSGTNIKGSFNIANWPQFTPQQKKLVWDRLTTDVEEKRMPRTKDGKAGRVSTDVLFQFATH